MVRLESSEKTKRLDLGAAHGEKAPGLVLSAFDGLAEGEQLLLESPMDLRPHFERLSVLRTGLFGWFPMEWEAGRHRALVARLRPKDREATVAGYFGRDHEEIDVLLEYVRRDLGEAVRSGGTPPATLRPYFEEFKRRLERHMGWEERLLFPAVESGALELAAGPGRVMRLEHQEIHRRIAELQELVRSSAEGENVPAAAQRLLEELLSILAGHNMKEEAVYYPLSDRRLSREESERLLSEVRLP